MDEMKLKLTTKFMRSIAAKFIKKAVIKNLGFEPELNINELEVEMIGEKIRFHIDVNGEINRDDLLKVTRLTEEGP